MWFKRVWVSLFAIGITLSAHAVDLNRLEADWCNDRIASHDALPQFRSLAKDAGLSADERLKARLYSMLCAAQCYDVIDTREAFRALDAATTQTEHKLLMDFVRIDLEGRDGPRDEAIKSLEVLLYEHPNVPFAHPMMASLTRFNLDAGRATEAFRWQDTLLSSYPSSSHTLALRAETYVQNTRIDKLNELYEQVKAQTAGLPDDPLRTYLHGFHLMFAGKDAQSIEALEAALLSAPDHSLNLLARCKLAALYCEAGLDDLCIEMVESFIQRLDPNLQFDPWCEASYYKLNRLWSMKRYRDSIDTAFSMDRDGWNTDQRHRVEGIVAEFFRRALDSIGAMGIEQSGLDAETVALLELRAQTALEKLSAEMEIWRPVSVGYTLYFNRQYRELIDYCDWALENRDLSAYLRYRLLNFKGIAYCDLVADSDSLPMAAQCFELIMSSTEEERRAITTLEWEFFLQERENLFTSSCAWLIQTHLSLRQPAEARKYYDRLKFEFPPGTTNARMIRRFASQVGD